MMYFDVKADTRRYVTQARTEQGQTMYVKRQAMYQYPTAPGPFPCSSGAVHNEVRSKKGSYIAADTSVGLLARLCKHALPITLRWLMH